MNALVNLRLQARQRDDVVSAEDLSALWSILSLPGKCPTEEEIEAKEGNWYRYVPESDEYIYVNVTKRTATPFTRLAYPFSKYGNL
jgi:Mn-dependent DtxR family transcriptional regulator